MSASSDTDVDESDAEIVSVHLPRQRRSRSSTGKHLVANENIFEIGRREIKAEVDDEDLNSSNNIVIGVTSSTSSHAACTESASQPACTESRRMSARLSPSNKTGASGSTSNTERITNYKEKTTRVLFTGDTAGSNRALPVAKISDAKRKQYNEYRRMARAAASLGKIAERAANPKRTTEKTTGDSDNSNCALPVVKMCISDEKRNLYNENRRRARAAESLEQKVERRADNARRTAEKRAEEKASLSEAVLAAKRAELAKRAVEKRAAERAVLSDTLLANHAENPKRVAENRAKEKAEITEALLTSGVTVKEKLLANRETEGDAKQKFVTVEDVFVGDAFVGDVYDENMDTLTGRSALEITECRDAVIDSKEKLRVAPAAASMENEMMRCTANAGKTAEITNGLNTSLPVVKILDPDLKRNQINERRRELRAAASLRKQMAIHTVNATRTLEKSADDLNSCLPGVKVLDPDAKRNQINERRRELRAAASLRKQIAIHTENATSVEKSADDLTSALPGVKVFDPDAKRNQINERRRELRAAASLRKQIHTENATSVEKSADDLISALPDVKTRDPDAKQNQINERREVAQAAASLEKQLAANARSAAKRRAEERAILSDAVLAAKRAELRRTTAAKRKAAASKFNGQRLAGMAEQCAELAAYAQKRKDQRAGTSLEAILMRRARNAQAMAAKRAAETPKQRAIRRAADTRRMATKRAAESANNEPHSLATDAKLNTIKIVAIAPDFSAAQRRLVSHLDAASGLSVDLHEDLTAEHLHYFKLDPMVALLAIATDIGIAYMSRVLSPKYPEKTQPNTDLEVNDELEMRDCRNDIPQIFENRDRSSLEDISNRRVMDTLGLSAVAGERDVNADERLTDIMAVKDGSLLASVDSAVHQSLAQSVVAPPRGITERVQHNDSLHLPRGSSLSLLDIIRTSKRAFFTGGDPFVCDKCNERFAEWSHLHDHMNLHAEEQNSLFQKTYTARRLIPRVILPGVNNEPNGGVSVLRIRPPVERPFVCATCNRKFSKQAFLDKHQQVHTGEHPFNCNTCNTGFPRLTALRRHEGLHTGVRPHVCEMCYLNFVTVPRLLKHMRKRHPSEERFVCEICKNGFTKVDHLRWHYNQRHRHARE